MPQHREPPPTEYHTRDRGLTLNTVITTVGGVLIMGLISIVGWFCSNQLSDLKGGQQLFDTKMDKFTDSQTTMQLDVNTLKTQLPDLTRRVDSVEKTQGIMWQQLHGPQTKPSTSKDP